tara:strand:+ start:5852 stop:7228 length:1377 start_codon:yes stop_codon:yes gene_type:complete
MRTFEILTLILTIGALTALLYHKDRRIFLYLIFGAILTILMQFFIEGIRWQFTFIIYFLPAMYITHKLQAQEINVTTKTLLMSWLILAGSILWIIPVFNLPSPGGKYSIGTEVHHWIDSSRAELFTEKKSDFRQIMIQIWYPADLKSEKKTEPYMDYIELRAKTLARAGGIPEFFPKHLNYISTNSHLNATVIISKFKLPILVFSHGITGSRHLHQALYEYLASRGFVIAALDHSYDANLTIFPDGSMADYRSNITGHPDSLALRKMQINTRGKDISFIINQMKKIQLGQIESNLNSRLDMDKIAVGGHSYGGATALVSSFWDPRIKTCLGLDPWISPLPKVILNSGLKIPQLFLMRPSWHNSDYPNNYKTLDTLILNSQEQYHRYIVKESEHLDFSDVPIFSPIIHWVMRDVSHLTTDISIDLLNNIVYEYLNVYLLGLSDSKFYSLLNHINLEQVQ